MQNITEILFHIMNLLNKASLNLTPIALKLLYFSTAFSIMYVFLKKTIETNLDNPLRDLLKVLLLAWFCRGFINNYVNITKAIYKTSLGIGLKAGGLGDSNLFFEPQDIFNKGLEILNKIFMNWEILNSSTYGFLIAWIFGLLIMFLLTLLFFIFYLEYFALISIAIIFIPFLVFEKTEFIGTKVFQILVSLNVKMIVFSFLSSIILSLLDTNINTIKTFQDAFTIVLSLGGLTFLMWRTPELASSLVGGTPSLNWNSFSQDSKGLKNAIQSQSRALGNISKSLGKNGFKGIEASKKGFNNAKTKISQMANFNRGRK